MNHNAADSTLTSFSSHKSPRRRSQTSSSSNSLKKPKQDHHHQFKDERPLLNSSTDASGVFIRTSIGKDQYEFDGSYLWNVPNVSIQQPSSRKRNYTTTSTIDKSPQIQSAEMNDASLSKSRLSKTSYNDEIKQHQQQLAKQTTPTSRPRKNSSPDLYAKVGEL